MISKDEFIISMVARYNEQKSHNLFINSINLLKKKSKFKFKILLVGSGINANNQKLFNTIKKFNLDHTIILLDYINDLNAIYNASDLLVLPSKYGESFPNVIAEAMMCGVKCISNDIGEAKKIINKYGVIIKDINEEKLYNSIKNELMILKMLSDLEKKNQRYLHREHIKKNFDIVNITNKYINLWSNKNII